jgi:hypothetical protein
MTLGPARGIGVLFNDCFVKTHCAPGATNSILDVQGVCVGHAYFKLGQYFINCDDNEKRRHRHRRPSVILPAQTPGAEPLGLPARERAAAMIPANYVSPSRRSRRTVPNVGI